MHGWRELPGKTLVAPQRRSFPARAPVERRNGEHGARWHPDVASFATRAGKVIGFARLRTDRHGLVLALRGSTGRQWQEIPKTSEFGFGSNRLHAGEASHRLLSLAQSLAPSLARHWPS